MTTVALVIFTLGLAIFFTGAESATFTVVNKCSYTIWPGTLTGAGKPQLSNTGFELASGASLDVDAPTGWSGRFWARTGCSTDASGRFSCTTADCGSGQVSCAGAGGSPPATLAELTLNGDGGLDFYDISLVDGFNVPVSLAPTGGCASTSCAADLNAACPAELAAKSGAGDVVGCKSACLAFGAPQYCCTWQFGSPDTCLPSEFSKIFKGLCPQAYSYAYDDKSSTFTCGGGPNYAVTFCP